jgi:hypothetical protein
MKGGCLTYDANSAGVVDQGLLVFQQITNTGREQPVRNQTDLPANHNKINYRSRNI